MLIYLISSQAKVNLFAYLLTCVCRFASSRLNFNFNPNKSNKKQHISQQTTQKQTNRPIQLCLQYETCCLLFAVCCGQSCDLSFRFVIHNRIKLCCSKHTSKEVDICTAGIELKSFSSSSSFSS